MSLDLSLLGEPRTVPCRCERCDHEHEREDRERFYDANITHNLARMFDEAGIYQILWHGDDLVAGDVLPRLEAALVEMRADPERFRAFEPTNKWGSYEDAMAFLRRVIEMCREHPTARLRCSR